MAPFQTKNKQTKQKTIWQKEKKSERPEDSVQDMEELRKDLTMLKLNSVSSKIVHSVVVEQKESQMVFGIVRSVERNLQEGLIT